MGYAQSIVLGSCSFILGMIFVCQVVDIPLLYQPLTETGIQNAYTFYELWYEAPGAVKWALIIQVLFHAALILPMLALLGKLHRWTEAAMFFDGSSLALHVATIIIFITVHIQSLRTFLPDAKPTTLWSILPVPPPRTVAPTNDEKVEAVRVLAAGNALIGLLTTGIILMQLGQEYAKRQEEKEQREIDMRTGAAESKKDI